MAGESNHQESSDLSPRLEKLSHLTHYCAAEQRESVQELIWDYNEEKYRALHGLITTLQVLYIQVGAAISDPVNHFNEDDISRRLNQIVISKHRVASICGYEAVCVFIFQFVSPFTNFGYQIDKTNLAEGVGRMLNWLKSQAQETQTWIKTLEEAIRKTDQTEMNRNYLKKQKVEQQNSLIGLLDQIQILSRLTMSGDAYPSISLKIKTLSELGYTQEAIANLKIYSSYLQNKVDEYFQLELMYSPKITCNNHTLNLFKSYFGLAGLYIKIYKAVEAVEALSKIQNLLEERAFDFDSGQYKILTANLANLFIVFYEICTRENATISLNEWDRTELNKNQIDYLAKGLENLDQGFKKCIEIALQIYEMLKNLESDESPNVNSNDIN